jgi:hypothetical protein
MVRRLVSLLASALAGGAIVAYAPAVQAAECPRVEKCGVGSDGDTITGIVIIPGMHGSGGSGGGSGGGCAGCEWTMTPACLPNGPEPGYDAMCGMAANSCASRGEDGILMRIYMREPGSGWRQMGTACIGGANDVITMADLQADARQYMTQLDPGAATIAQHPADRAVVNLPTYFSASGAGTLTGTFGPAAARVTITATPEYVWSWGDGSPSLTTTSTGGPYPGGDVHHTYRSPGSPAVTLTTRWAASFVVDTAFGQFGPFDVGGPQIAPSTTRVVRVREGRAELVSPRLVSPRS